MILECDRSLGQGLDLGFVEICDDSSIMNMQTYLDVNTKVLLYIEHLASLESKEELLLEYWHPESSSAHFLQEQFEGVQPIVEEEIVEEFGNVHTELGEEWVQCTSRIGFR